MRKLKKAEIAFLKAIPKDLELSDKVFPGVLYTWMFPKGTNCRTIENLWKLDLLKLGRVPVSWLPCSLTEKGKKALRSLDNPDVEEE